MMHALGISREELLLQRDRKLTENDLEAVERLVKRRLNREPMSQILGKREFWGRDFIVTSDTLTPRPDSETLIEAVLHYAKNMQGGLRILDMGTGTGCLLLTLLAELPNATGVGVDISEAALNVAKKNAEALGLNSRVEFLQQSWAEGITEQFDIIISNPPYIPAADIAELEPEVKQYEPQGALVGGEDGLVCYRDIAPYIRALLRAGGVAALEIGQGQERDVEQLLVQQEFSSVEMYKDLGGIIRCLLVRNL